MHERGARPVHGVHQRGHGVPGSLPLWRQSLADVGIRDVELVHALRGRQHLGGEQGEVRLGVPVRLCRRGTAHQLVHRREPASEIIPHEAGARRRRLVEHRGASGVASILGRSILQLAPESGDAGMPRHARAGWRTLLARRLTVKDRRPLGRGGELGEDREGQAEPDVPARGPVRWTAAPLRVVDLALGERDDHTPVLLRPGPRAVARRRPGAHFPPATAACRAARIRRWSASFKSSISLLVSLERGTRSHEPKPML